MPLRQDRDRQQTPLSGQTADTSDRTDSRHLSQLQKMTSHVTNFNIIYISVLSMSFVMV